MIEDVKVYNYLYFFDSIKIDNEIWFSAININGLYKMNYLTKQIEFQCFFPNENYGQAFLYSKVFYYKNKLIFIPFQAKYIAVYDIKNKKMYSTKIPNTYDSEYSFFYTALQDENIIYMIPCRYRKMIKFNVANNGMELIDVIVNDEKHRWNKNFPFIDKGACRIKDYIYFGCYSANFIERFAIYTGEIKYYDIPIDIGGISHLISEEDMLWVVGRNGVICKWSDLNGIEQVIEIKKGVEKVQAFFDVCIYKGILFLSGSTSRKIYLYNTKTGILSTTQINHEDSPKDFKIFWGNYTSMNRINNERINVLSALNGKMYEINYSGMVVETFEMKYRTDKNIIRYLMNQIKSEKVKIESRNRVGHAIYSKLKF